ncbi:MAG: stage III sporulation protein AD [Eubacteriales bacterium]|nr:stage III sporulation protein AD [Eubacteriales bacterium]
MEIVKIAIIGIVAGVLVVTIKQKQPELGLQVSIVAGLIIFIYVLDYLITAVDYIKDIVTNYDIPYESITIVLKIIGIAYICEFAVQILKDTGESSLASKVELAGRVFIIVLSLPIITSFMKMILGLLG